MRNLLLAPCFMLGAFGIANAPHAAEKVGASHVELMKCQQAGCTGLRP